MSTNDITAGIEKLLIQWEEHKSAILCTRLTDMFRRARRLEEAVNLALEGLDSWPANTSITIVLARTYSDAGDLKEAFKYFKEVHERQPRNLVVLKNLGEISYTRGHLDEAAQYFSDYLAEHPGDDDLREKLDDIRSTSVRMPLKDTDAEEPGDNLDEDDITEIEEEIPAEFPKTERMAKVLQEQGIAPDSKDETEAEAEAEKNTGAVIVEAVKDEEKENLSLLDYLSEEEREKYGLKPYDGEKR